MKDIMTIPMMLKKPSGFLPIAMSLAAIAVVLVHLARFGVTREADEGTSAHIWQLLMAGQAPIVAFFIIRWLPQVPRPTLVVLALQTILALAAMAPIYLLHL